MKYYLLLFCCILVSACTAPSSSLNYADAEIGEPNDERAVVVVYRKMVAPILYPVSVHLETTKKASLPNNSFTWFYAVPGTNEIRFKWPALTLQPGSKQQVEFTAGNTYYIEFKSNMGFSSVAYVVNSSGVADEKLAKDELKECCKYIQATP